MCFAHYAGPALAAFDALTDDEKWGVAFAVRYEWCRDPNLKRDLIAAKHALGVHGVTYTPMITTLARAIDRDCVAEPKPDYAIEVAGTIVATVTRKEIA